MPAVGKFVLSLKGSGNILPVSNSQVSLSNGFHWKAYSSLAARVRRTVLVSLTIDELRAKSHGPVISSPYLFIDVQCQSVHNKSLGISRSSGCFRGFVSKVGRTLTRPACDGQLACRKQNFGSCT